MGGLCSLFLCVSDVCLYVCVCVQCLRGSCMCVCTMWGGCTPSDQKQSALVQSVSVPTFTHKRQGTRVCQSAPTYTYTHTLTHLSHSHTYTVHTLNTPTLPLQGTLRDLSPLAKSRSPQHLHHGWRDHSGKQETEVSVLGAIYHAGSMALWWRELGRQSDSTCPFQKHLYSGATWLIGVWCSCFIFTQGLTLGALQVTEMWMYLWSFGILSGYDMSAFCFCRCVQQVFFGLMTNLGDTDLFCNFDSCSIVFFWRSI